MQHFTIVKKKKGHIGIRVSIAILISCSILLCTGNLLFVTVIADKPVSQSNDITEKNVVQSDVKSVNLWDVQQMLNTALFPSKN